MGKYAPLGCNKEPVVQPVPEMFITNISQKYTAAKGKYFEGS